jgi:uncharacterized protein YcbX
LDRAWALYSADGRWVNGKRTPAIHLIRAAYTPEVSAVTLSVPGDRREIPAMTFAFPGDPEGAAEWFSVYFEQPIQVRHARAGFPDDGLAAGPTIVSTASLEAVRRWFPEMDLDEARRRFRITLEIDGTGAGDASNAPTNGVVPAFWEDRLFAAEDTRCVRFRIGEVAFEGSNPCARCPVPSRNSRTGAADAMFQRRFSELRQAELPSWAPVERFDHFYRLATNTRVPGTEQGKLLRVGDLIALT